MYILLITPNANRKSNFSFKNQENFGIYSETGIEIDSYFRRNFAFLVASYTAPNARRYFVRNVIITVVRKGRGVIRENVFDAFVRVV